MSCGWRERRSGQSSGRLVPRLSLGKALQPVVGDRLPGRGVGDEGAPARAHARVAVERAEADAHVGRVVGVPAEQVRAALAAEALLEAAARRPPALDELLAGEQAEGAAVDPGLGRRRGAGAALAAGAVAV